MSRRIATERSAASRLLVLRTLEEVSPYRDLWLRLCRYRDADPDFYEFFLSSRQAASAYVLLLDAGATQVLILSRLETDKLDNKLGYFKLGSPRLRILEIIPGGILGDIDARSARVVAEHLGRLLRGSDVDMIRLHYADVLNPLYVELARTHPFRFSQYRVKTTLHRSRKVDANLSTFAESISRNERSNQRRRERKLIEEYHGNVRIECYQSVESLPRLFSDAERVSVRSYQRGLGVGFAPTEEIRHRLEFLANRGWLRGWLLYLAEDPVAFWIGAVREGVFSSDYLAYDSRYSDMAPGTYLTIKALEIMHDRQSGVHVIDFSPGDAPYKARFGTEVRTVATVNMFALTWRGLYANALEDATLIASSVAKSALEKLGALDWLKRTGRRRAIEGSD